MFDWGLIQKVMKLTSWGHRTH